jgi:hypothetical protein
VFDLHSYDQIKQIVMEKPESRSVEAIESLASFVQSLKFFQACCYSVYEAGSDRCDPVL